MSIQFTNSQVEAKITKAIKGLSLTQAKPPSKQEFIIDAIDHYFNELVKKKFIK
tara:strand:+ start:279 stop:440 length:162 start_codon:yes stop_codon:yes gene_type:complete